MYFPYITPQFKNYIYQGRNYGIRIIRNILTPYKTKIEKLCHEKLVTQLYIVKLKLY